MPLAITVNDSFAKKKFTLNDVHFMYTALSSETKGSLCLSAKFVAQYILSANFSKFGDLVACELYVMLSLTFSLVLITPEILSEVFKLSSQNHSTLWPSVICTIIEISFKDNKKNKRKHSSQKDTPFSLRGLYHQILRQN